ncbi:MAG TPA: hypothetical protein VNJ70_19480 [Thermoanaerobaculia bacterium]|nr:hypothetical protein [Thermoanaerobaculia bacterium]
MVLRRRAISGATLFAAALAAAAQAPPAPTPAAPAAPPPPLRSMPAGGLPADAAALLVSGQEGGALPFAVLALPLPGTGERARVAVRVEIDGATLLAATAEPPVRAEVYLYALDERGRIGDSLLEVLEVDAERLGDELAAGGAALSGQLALLPGAYTLRALVRAPTTGVLGLRAIPLAVPDFRRGEPALLPPLFPAPAGGWLEASASRGAAPPDVLGTARAAARAVLAPGAAATAELPAWRAGEAGEVTLEARPDAAGQGDGAAPVTLPARVTGRRATSIAGLDVLTVEFETGFLPPGSYALAASLAGARSATAAVVIAAGAEGTTWAQLGDASGPAVAAAAPGAPAAARPARRNRYIAAAVVRTAFREALGRLAAGETAAARAALRDLEVAELGGAGPADPEALAKVELGVAVDLAAAQPEALVPVLLLYQQLNREHLEAKRFLPTTHTAEMTFALAGLYADRGGPGARPLAARLLVALALADLDRPLGGFALRALREALALRPDDEVALLALAVEAERRALYREAVERLERLRRLRPADAEVRLRLAVNLARVGNEREGLRILEELTRASSAAATGDTGAEWPVAVAFHELARLRLADEKPADAERIARAGLARFPRDEKLVLLLALALDLQGRGADARQELAALTPDGDGAASPRHRYARLPEGALARARRELERSAAERLPSLAAALGGREAGGTRPGGAR